MASWITQYFKFSAFTPTCFEATVLTVTMEKSLTSTHWQLYTYNRSQIQFTLRHIWYIQFHFHRTQFDVYLSSILYQLWATVIIYLCCCLMTCYLKTFPIVHWQIYPDCRHDCCDIYIQMQIYIFTFLLSSSSTQ